VPDSGYGIKNHPGSGSRDDKVCDASYVLLYASYVLVLSKKLFSEHFSVLFTFFFCLGVHSADYEHIGMSIFFFINLI
jgi:hypothetical protein